MPLYAGWNGRFLAGETTSKGVVVKLKTSTYNLSNDKSPWTSIKHRK